MAKLVSKVYGEALFEAAVDHGNAIQLMNETAQLEKILEDNQDFDKLMNIPESPNRKNSPWWNRSSVAESVMI